MATGEDWSRDEVGAIVADYLSMLESELAGQRFNKAEHRRALALRLSGRSEGSIEFKHCNISAVMLELGLPYVKGYQPRANFQRSLLPAVVVDQIRQRHALDPLALGVPATRIHEIVKERRGITADTAERLARYFGADAASWLSLQADCDLKTLATRTDFAREVLPRAASNA